MNITGVPVWRHIIGDPVLWEVRKRIAISYSHKALLLVLAVCGFISLRWLGHQKTEYENRQTSEWTITEPRRSAVEMETGQSLCAVFEPRPASASQAADWCVQGVKYSTREQLISALQDIAEAPEWARFRVWMSAERARLEEKIEKNPSAEKALYADFADVLAKKETYVKISADTVRRSVAARLGTVDLAPQPPSSPDDGFAKLLEPTFDEKRDTYIIYEILWYASLLLGVVASSLLLVIVFTALPITSAEGYWTKRIGELLDRSPRSVHRAIVPPLLTATLAGGMIAGSVGATEPGGNARTYVDHSTRIDQGDQVTNEGDIILEGKPPTPPSDDQAARFNALNQRLDDLTTAVKSSFSGLDSRLESTSSTVVNRIGAVESGVENHVSQMSAAVQREVDALDQPVHDTAATAQGTLGSVNGLKQPVQDALHGLGKLTGNVDTYAQQSTQEAETIQQNQKQQREVVQRSLAQNAQSDSRGFLGRTFGRTLYQVGPHVVETMDARLAERHAPDADQKALNKALTAMQGKPPVNSRQLKSDLYAELLKSVSPDRAESIIQTDFPSLRRICALPR